MDDRKDTSTELISQEFENAIKMSRLGKIYHILV